MSPGLISVNDGAAADCGREIQNNILVHIIIAPPTSSPRLLRIIWIMVDKFKAKYGCPGGTERLISNATCTEII